MKLDGVNRTGLRLAGLLLFFVCGCKPAPSQNGAAPSTATSRPLRIVVVDDEPLASAIKREWSAQSQATIEVNSTSADDFAIDVAKQTDVVIFPTNWLGTLVEHQAIRPLPKSVTQASATAAEDYDWSDVLPLVRREEIRWGAETYAVSFGSPQLLVYYRQDLFQQWNLKLPTTWEEYQSVVEQIGRRMADESAAAELQAATVEPLGTGWAARTFLARSAAYARHRSQYSMHFDFASMQPLINTPPYVRALQELIATSQSMPDASVKMTPYDVATFLLEGKAVLGLSWPHANRSPTAPKVSIGFTDLPGAVEVYQPSEKKWQARATGQINVPLLAIDGRLGAITRYTASSDSAANFLLWLTSKQQSPRISTRGNHTTLFRESQLEQPQAWVEPALAAAATEYADVVRREQDQTSWVIMPRIPGQQRYLQVLDAAIRAAVSGQLDAQATLDEVAQAWSNITNELGVEVQRKAYLRDIGVE